MRTELLGIHPQKIRLLIQYSSNILLWGTFALCSHMPGITIVLCLWQVALLQVCVHQINYLNFEQTTTICNTQSLFGSPKTLQKSESFKTVPKRCKLLFVLLENGDTDKLSHINSLSKPISSSATGLRSPLNPFLGINHRIIFLSFLSVHLKNWLETVWSVPVENLVQIFRRLDYKCMVYEEFGSLPFIILYLCCRPASILLSDQLKINCRCLCGKKWHTFSRKAGFMAQQRWKLLFSAQFWSLHQCLSLHGKSAPGAWFQNSVAILRNWRLCLRKFCIFHENNLSSRTELGCWVVRCKAVRPCSKLITPFLYVWVSSFAPASLCSPASHLPDL